MPGDANPRRWCDRASIAALLALALARAGLQRRQQLIWRTDCLDAGPRAGASLVRRWLAPGRHIELLRRIVRQGAAAGCRRDAGRRMPLHPDPRGRIDADHRRGRRQHGDVAEIPGHVRARRTPMRRSRRPNGHEGRRRRTHHSRTGGRSRSDHVPLRIAVVDETASGVETDRDQIDPHSGDGGVSRRQPDLHACRGRTELSAAVVGKVRELYRLYRL